MIHVASQPSLTRLREVVESTRAVWSIAVERDDQQRPVDSWEMMLLVDRETVRQNSQKSVIVIRIHTAASACHFFQHPASVCACAFPARFSLLFGFTEKWILIGTGGGQVLRGVAQYGMTPAYSA